MKKPTYLIVSVALMAAVTVILSQLSIQIGAIPFSFGLLAVMLCGCLQSPLGALLSQVVYIVLGMIGLPVFAGFKGGLQCLVGPTGGFIISYPIVALIISLSFIIGEKYIKGRYLKIIITILGHITGLAICYFLGTFMYVVTTGVDIKQALLVCVVPFILFDLIKITVSIIMSSLLRKKLIKRLLI